MRKTLCIIQGSDIPVKDAFINFSTIEQLKAGIIKSLNINEKGFHHKGLEIIDMSTRISINSFDLTEKYFEFKKDLQILIRISPSRHGTDFKNKYIISKSKDMSDNNSSLVKNKITTLDYYNSKLIVALIEHQSQVEDIEQEMLDNVMINELDISVRLLNILKANDVITLRDLLEIKESKMKEMHGMGRSAMTELINTLSLIGFYRPYYSKYIS